MNKQFLDRCIAGVTKKQNTAFPEATEEKILRAAKEAADTGAITPVLVGDPEEIKAAAENFGIDISEMLIISNKDEAAVSENARKYHETHDLMSEKSLIRRSKDSLFYAMVLLSLGLVDCAFAGLTHTTGDVILNATTVLGFKEGITAPSSIGLVDIPGYEGEYGSMFAISDSAVNIQPDQEALADIAIASCETVQALMGWSPKCALVSFSTDGSADHPMVDKIKEAVKIANEKRPDLEIDGEFQLDAAINPKIAAKKVKRDSSVAGHANIIVWPDLNVGNIGVKLLQQFAKADAYGPLLQGFAKPVSDCSRSAPVSELVGNILMLATVACNNK